MSASLLFLIFPLFTLFSQGLHFRKSAQKHYYHFVYGNLNKMSCSVSSYITFQMKRQNKQKLTLALAVSDRLSLLAERSFCAERFSCNKNSNCQKQKVAPQERVTKNV